MRQKKLLFLTHYDLQATPYGDILLPMLFEDGWDLTVVAPNASRSILRQVWPYTCRPYDCAAAGRRRDLQLLGALIRGRLTRNQVLYLHSQSAAVTSGLAVIGCRKLVYHTPDYYDPLRYPLRSFLEGRVARAASLYLDNEFHRAYIARAQHRLRGRILTAPPNLPAAWPIPPRDPATRARMTGGRTGAFVLMLHGGYSRNRMTDELFQALAALPEDFRLVMTCDSAVAEQRLRDLGLLDRVIRLPYCDYHSMLRFTVNADAGVLLYSNNDLGNFFTAPGRLTEYLACGLPVIASDHTGIESLVLKFRLGTSVTAPQPASIAAGLLRLRDLISANALPSDHCRAQFLKHFAIDHWKEAICEAFNAVLTEGRHRGASPPPWPWMPTANAD